uniref:Uncharacterized protein n=1 Tax=Aegilops tauschii subsp. strangulata TaxID=200361 RepID=A0A453IF26_AEGTS
GSLSTRAPPVSPTSHAHGKARPQWRGTNARLGSARRSGSIPSHAQRSRFLWKPEHSHLAISTVQLSGSLYSLVGSRHRRRLARSVPAAAAASVAVARQLLALPPERPRQQLLPSASASAPTPPPPPPPPSSPPPQQPNKPRRGEGRLLYCCSLLPLYRRRATALRRRPLLALRFASCSRRVLPAGRSAFPSRSPIIPPIPIYRRRGAVRF